MDKRIVVLFFLTGLISVLFCILFTHPGRLEANKAESQQIQWSRTYGGIYSEYGYFVEQTRDGGYIVGGSTNSFGAGGRDIYLVKTDPFGRIVWSRTYGGEGSDYAYSVQQTRDGGFVAAGYTYSFQEAYDAQVYLIKTDSFGAVQWSRTYGYTTYDYYCYSVQQTTDGGYILAGGRYSYPGGTDVYLLKTDTLGYLEWSRTYGGTNYDYGYSVQQTADGGYIVVGYTYSFGAGDYDVYLIKTDNLGYMAWSRTYGGSDWDYGYSVKQTTDGGYIVGGYTDSFTEGYDSDAYLIKTDDLGYIRWSRTYGGTGYDYAYSVEQTTDQGYICTGGTDSFGEMYDEDVYLIRTDSSGEVVWARTYGDTSYEYGRCVRQTADGGYVVVRYASMGELAGGAAAFDDIMLTKFDSFGNTCIGEFVSSTGYSVSTYTSTPGTEEFYPETQVASPATMTTSPATDTTTICEFILEPEFIVEVRPDTNSLCVGGSSADYYVILTSVGEFGYPCTLFAVGLPPGVTGSFYPPVVFPPDTSILLLNVPDPISADTYVFTIFAQWVFYEDTLRDSTQAYLTVSNPPLFIPVVDSVIFFAEESNTLWVEASDPDSTDTLTLMASQGPWDFTQTDSVGGHASGFLSWAPAPQDTLNSPYWAAFFAQDNYLCEGIDSCRIFVVYDVNHPPVLDSIGPKTVMEGDILEFRIHARDEDEDPIILDTLNVPSNATFIDSGNGAGSFTFAPDYTQSGTYYVTFIASDTAGLADSEQVTIEVFEFNRAPEIYLDPSFSDTAIYERNTLSFWVWGSDPDSDPLFLQVFNLPQGAFFDLDTGEFDWTPEWGEVGVYDSILFEVSDGKLSDSQYISIAVKNQILEVEEHSPGPGVEDVLIDADIHVTLSEPIKFWTVDSSTFVVESRKDGILRGVLIYTENNRLLGFSLPSDSMFSALDTITVRLTTGIKDLADSGMAGDYSWEFYTGIGVYPGNTNNDNIVDERDILPLGFYWGETGPSRNTAYQNLTWSIKPVHRWTADSSWDPEASVYADADGNGIVDEWDICGVSDNWDSTVSGSVYKLQEAVDLAEEVPPEHLSIYEKIYNALLDCPESEGKRRIKKLLEEIVEGSNTPSKFELSQNYPNPFNLTTVIRYSLPEDCQVEISIFNILGQKVRTLVNQYQTSGYKKVTWDGKDDKAKELGSGIYFYRVNARDYSCARKLLLLK